MVCVVYVSGDRPGGCSDGQTLSGQTGIKGYIAESSGNPCDLFSRSNGSLCPKGHCSSAFVSPAHRLYMRRAIITKQQKGAGSE